MCRKYPNSRWFIARRHLKDLDNSSVATFLKVVREYEGSAIDGYTSDRFWRYSRQGGFIVHLRNGARIDLLATEYLPQDPLFNRFGSIEFTGGWLEEVQETSRTASDVLLTRIGRHLNGQYNLPGKCLLTCNPSKGWLYTDFYRPFISGTLPPDKAVILATMKDNAAYLPQEYIRRMESIADPTIRQRLAEGQWEWDDEQGFLIPARLVALAVETPAENGAVTVGIDVAQGGAKADQTVIQVIRGNMIEPPIIIESGDFQGDPALFDEWLAERLAGIIEGLGDLEENAIRLDASGCGDGILQKLKHTHGLGVWPFRGSAQPFPRRGSQAKLANLRSQAYWELKEGLRLRKWHLPANFDELLFDDLCNQKYQIKNDVVLLEDKVFIRRRLGRSPDRGDALSMAALKLPEIIQGGNIVAVGGAKRPAQRTRNTRPGHFVEEW